MSSWVDFFYFFIIGAALLLSALGLWFSAVVPMADRWSKRFFLAYFVTFMLCCLSSIVEGVLSHYPVSSSAVYLALVLESLLLSIPLPMLTIYLLHCCGEDMRRSRLFHIALGLWAAYASLLAVASLVDGFAFITPDGTYYRGPLYPVLILPLVALLFVNFAGVMRRRSRLSRKALLGFVVAIAPMTVAMIVQLFAEVFPLVDIAIVLSALSMYSFALSDQIERDLSHQREIARQQQQIAHERASVMVLQMRPHFIYNTLMSIYSLCNLDPQKARQVTADFTDYLRKNFNAVASDSAIPFSAELEHTRAYLAVEQARFEDMLLVDYDVQYTHFRLPPLTLQPIAENAVKHGMDPYAGPLRVCIRTRRTNAGIEVAVEDNGPGFDPYDEHRRHTTLTNICQRLEMMCGGSMDIKPRAGGGTVVTMTIPLAQALPS